MTQIQHHIKPIFITGVERSGNTLVAKVISECGAFKGYTTKMQENSGVKKWISILYEQLGTDPACQYPLPNLKKLIIPNDWRNIILEELTKQGYSGIGPFMLKGPFLAQIWPIWNYAFPEAQWVIVRRKPTDIIKSCQRTTYMRAFSDAKILHEVAVEIESEGWRWWIKEHESIFVQMITEGLDCKTVWPQRMLRGDYSQIFDMIRWLGLRWNSKAVTEVDILLNKTRQKQMP